MVLDESPQKHYCFSNSSDLFHNLYYGKLYTYSGEPAKGKTKRIHKSELLNYKLQWKLNYTSFKCNLICQELIITKQFATPIYPLSSVLFPFSTC